MEINADMLASSMREALSRNEHETGLCLEYKNDLLVTTRNLQSFQSRVRVDVMVPLGKYALMPGHLYHTNEVLIGKPASQLGDVESTSDMKPAGLFIESTTGQAVDVLNQRLKAADKRLKELEVESEFLRNKLEYPQERDVFANGTQQEIIEQYDEETEKSWRVAHRQKVKAAKLREREARNNVKDEDYEAVLEKLDELELMEELQEEFSEIVEPEPVPLDGLVEFKEKPRVSYALDSFSSSDLDLLTPPPSSRIAKEDCIEFIPTEVPNAIPDQPAVVTGFNGEGEEMPKKKKRKSLQFSEDLEKVKLINKMDRPNTLITRYDPDSTLQLHFTHSPIEYKPPPQSSAEEEQGIIICSPVDIYKKFAHCMKHWSAPSTPDDQPRSILKKTNHVIPVNRKARLLSDDDPPEEHRPQPVSTPIFNQVVGEVQERKSSAIIARDNSKHIDSTNAADLPPTKRPVSRFKASRS